MSKSLRTTVIIWLVLFALISFYHSYIFHLWMNAQLGFYSTYSDVLIIGGILTFISLASTFLLFIWLVHLIRKYDRTTSNLIRINVIVFVSSLIALYVTADLNASWWEGLYYVGTYAIPFLAIINIYFRKAGRHQLD